MKTLYESLLGDLEDNLANGDKDMIKSLNIPTTKDFKHSLYGTKVQYVVWKTPLITQFVRKYSNFKEDYNAIRFVLDNTLRSCHLYIVLLDINSNGMLNSKAKMLWGWNSFFAGSTMQKYKNMTIKIIKKLAADPDLLDEILKHANECDKFCESDEFSKFDDKDLYELTYK